MRVTDTFTIVEFDSLGQGDFTVTFQQDGAVVTPDYTITNEGAGLYTLTFDPAATGSWWSRVVYTTYKFEQTYEVGPIEPDEDIPIEHQPRATDVVKDMIWSDRISVLSGESHRIFLPRVAGTAYSVNVTPEDMRGVQFSVRKVSTFFDINCKMFDTLAGEKPKAIINYTVLFWENQDRIRKRIREDVTRRRAG